MDYLLRDVRNSDIEWLYQLNEESYRDVVVRQFGGWDEELQTEMFSGKWRIPRPAKIVMSGTEKVGLVVLEEQEHCDSLQEIQIRDEYHGLGLGTRLILSFLDNVRARNCPLRLRVLHENHRAKRLYERLGFRDIDKLENHYLMEIDLFNEGLLLAVN